MLYNEICENLKINCSKDYESAVILNSYCGRNEEMIRKRRNFENKSFLIVGPEGKHLNPAELEEILIVADSAIELIPENIVPHIIVTDLDGNMGKILKFHRGGSILVIHAHGDNIPELKTYLPKMNNSFIGTCQCEIVGNLLNLEGFTDGDRAVKLAQMLRAKSIKLRGFNFTKPVKKIGSRDKAIKLKYAEQIILDVVKSRTGVETDSIPEVF
jgi:uncharacterized Rossmann fold enzyme